MGKKQKFDYHTIIIGSGPAGSVAAGILSSAGKKVAMVEAGKMGGECPNTGCVPSKAMLRVAEIYADAKEASNRGIRSGAMGYNYPSIKAWKDHVVRRTGVGESKKYYESLGVDVIKGEAHFLTHYEITVNRQHYTAGHFIIASGTETSVPHIQGLVDVGYITHVETLELTRPPKSIFIVGGGAIGCEFAQLFATFGSKVHIADISRRLMLREDSEISAGITEVFHKDYDMNIITDAKVLSVEKEGMGKRVKYRVGENTHSVKVDEIMIASGKKAVADFGLENAGVEYTPHQIETDEAMQTSKPNIYAVGDVAGPFMFTHTAIYQGRIAANNILHPRKPVYTDYRAVPRVIYVRPEVAAVGLTEEECIKRAIDYKKAVAPLSIIGRTNIAGVKHGFAKVLTDKHGILIGGSVMAPHAGEIIHELGLAIQWDLFASDVAGTLHAFPSWSEVIRVACAKIKL